MHLQLLPFCVYISVFSLAYSDRSTPAFCPARCTCHRNSIFCSKAQLYEIPPLPKSCTFVELSENSVEHVRRMNFDQLSQLQGINLGSNKIRTLDDGAFETLQELKVLNLTSNRISVIGANTFRGLEQLRRLYLRANDLTALHPQAFVSLPRLVHLDLRGNGKLHPVPTWNALVAIKSLQQLLVDERLIKCDCDNLRIIRSILGKSPRLLLNTEQCTSPSHRIGSSVRTLSVESECSSNREVILECELNYESGNKLPIILWYKDGKIVRSADSETTIVVSEESSRIKRLEHRYRCAVVGNEEAVTRVKRINRQSQHAMKNTLKITVPPENIDANKNENVTFACRVRSNPPARVQWFLNGRIILNSERFQLRSGRQQLSISGVQPKDSGTYTCVAENGISQASATAFLQVRAAPEFRVKPQNAVVLEGAKVTIECEASGYPRPSIVWTRNGRSLPVNRRIAVDFSGTILTINPVSIEDEGEYICFAANHLGSIRSSANVYVKQSMPPRILHSPSSMTVSVGQTVSFPCRVTGSPRPTVSWLFNGNLIRTVKGHFEVTTQNTLYVHDVTIADAGVYTCQASNDVGSMSADVALEVIQSSAADVKDVKVDSKLIHESVRQATENVDKAISFTRQRLYNNESKSAAELMALLRYPGPAALEQARAREIYEQTISLVQSHVVQGLHFNLSGNFEYPHVLSAGHVALISELTGCNLHREMPHCNDMCFHRKFRTYDGSCNNFEHPLWGASLTSFRRILPPIYENGFDQPVGWRKGHLYNGYPMPNPRVISQMLISTEQVTNDQQYSHMLMQWGQFLDHDLTLTVNAPSVLQFQTGVDCKRTCQNRPPCFNIEIPPDDRRIKYGVCMEFERSSATCGSGDTSVLFDKLQYREQLNVLTAYIDASNVYGSEEADALNLRDLFSDHGLLKFDVTSHKQKPYLPFNRNLPMDCRRNASLPHSTRCMMAGDYRANEQAGLLAMHTLWLRHHNRLAAQLLKVNPHWDGERIYQETRKIVGAQIQHITFQHWLPKILGPSGMEKIGPYKGYDPSVDSSMTNAFATAAFRFGHTLIQPLLLRLNASFQEHPSGHLPLGEAFFAPERVLDEGGIDPLLRGMFAGPAKLPKAFQYLNSELTEKLFSKAHDVALDLASLNIQRGRDHALPGYLQYRKWCNLSTANSFEELHDIPEYLLRKKLQILYGHPANIDLWVGGLLERTLPESKVGPTFACILIDQFRRIRDGDRFWYENPGIFTSEQLYEIRKSTLAKILCANGDEINRVQPDVFINVGSFMPNMYPPCSQLSSDLNLHMWQHCCDDCKPQLRFEDVDDEVGTEEIQTKRRK